MPKGKKSKYKSDFKTIVPIIVAVVIVIVGVNLYLQSITPESSTEPFTETTGTSAESTSAEEQEQRFMSVTEKNQKFLRAPGLQGISGYINVGSGEDLQELTEDKIILVDFWTYSCINCQRTTPYLNEWHEKYFDNGLVIIGVHSPEFAFEKDYSNVVDAVERFEIKYPVVQDNDFETWRAYNNRYWPRKYIVDIDGFIRYDHIGEGAYDQTELVIQDLLSERAFRLNLEMDMDKNLVRPEDAVDTDFVQIETPEIYFGTKFLFGRNYIGNFNQLALEREYEYIAPDVEQWRDNIAYLDGTWFMTTDYSELRGDGGLIGIKYSAKIVNLVAGGSGKISVIVDGEQIDEITVDANRLYNLVSSESYGAHTLELMIEGNVQAYAFTFG